MFYLRSRTIITVALLIVISGVGTHLAIQAFNAPSPPTPAFKRPQWIELQIVTAPTESTRAGFRYNEADIVIHSTHRILIDAAGNGRTFFSVSNEIPIEISYSSAEPISSGEGILLKDLSFYFPVKFRVNENTSYFWQSFSSTDSEVPADYHSFQRDISIYYQEEPLSNTFVRMRHLGALTELPVIDLAPAMER